MLPKNWAVSSTAEIFPWAPLNDEPALAQRLFAGLRDLDARNVTTIICPLPAATGLGLAIQDRLKKAARTK
jgi:L-threonylcarbamoyladenylate synthase